MERSNLPHSERGPTAPSKTPISSCSCKRGKDGQFGRNLVVCIDGTANKFGMQNTNVVELYSRLVKDETQLTYYNSGIGTRATRRSRSSFWGTMLEMAIGSNIEANVLDAYEWLSENYRSGDRIFLFGFSRGAYQVRIIAGMIEKVGLLHKGNKQQIPFAYDLYIKVKTKQEQQELVDEKLTGIKARNYRQRIRRFFHRRGDSSPDADSDVKDVANGVSSGVERGKATVHGSGLNTRNDKKHKSDEMCQHFKNTLSHIGAKVHFVGCWDTVSSVGLVRRASLPETTNGMAHVCAFRHALALDELRVKFLPEYVNGGAGPRLEQVSATGGPTEGSVEQTGPAQSHKTGNIKEVWFAGCHSDVGGGNVENLKTNKFGPALRWMTYESITWGLRMTPFEQSWKLIPPSSSMTPLWKVLEYTIPFKRLSYKGPNHITRRLHRASPRQILPGQLLHESVFEHIPSPNLKAESEATLPNTSSVRKWYQKSKFDRKTRPYKPLALLPEISSESPTEKLIWDIEELQEHHLIEKDPYQKPSQILDGIKEVKEISNAEYNALLTASYIEIGLRAIRERQDAEEVLISALENEVRRGGSDQRISIIAKILDRCFDLVPKGLSNINSDVWKFLDKLYEGTPATRSKFLRRFADDQIRMEIAMGEIEQATMTLLESNSKPVAQIDAVATMAMAILQLFIMKPEPVLPMHPHRKWMYDAYRKFLTFRDLSEAGRYNVLIDFLDDAVGYTDQQSPGNRENYLDKRILLFKQLQYPSPKDNQQAIFAETQSRSRYVNILFSHAYELHRQIGERTQPTTGSDLDEVILLYGQYNEVQHPLHPDRSASLSNLGNALLTRYEQRDEPSDLKESISCYMQVLELQPAPHPGRSWSLGNLGNALRIRFEQGREPSDLEESISCYKQALELRPVPHPDRSWSLNDLGNVLRIQFEQGREPSDLEESISCCKQALELQPAPHPDRSWSLSNLGNVLRIRFGLGGQPSDLEESISCCKQALELQPVPHPDRSWSLNNLGNALRIRFEQGREPSDLEESISCYKQALELQPAPHPHRSWSLSNLGNVLRIRFGLGGQPSDLEESISCCKQALELQPVPHPDRSWSLNNLGNALRIRFEQGREPSDLEESISCHKQALELQPAPHPDRSWSLNNLGIALRTRFDQSRKRCDIEESKALLMEALEFLPSNDLVGRPYVLDSLAGTLHSRFEFCDGEQPDIEKSISLFREVLVLMPASRYDLPEFLNNLGVSLRARFEKGIPEPNNIEESIRIQRQALALLSPRHILRPKILDDLATALEVRFKKRESQESDLDEAKSLREEAQKLREDAQKLHKEAKRLREEQNFRKEVQKLMISL